MADRIVWACVFMAVASTALAQTAAELNVQGYRAYQSKDLAKAGALFSEAIARDPEYALAHYNLACVLALARAAGGECEFDAYRSTIREHLEQAVALDPGRRQRLKKDPDLKSVHDTVWFQALAGVSVKDPKNVPYLLQHVSWYGATGEGVFSSVVLRQLTFASDGTLRLVCTSIQIEEETSTPLTNVTIKGTYKVNGRKVHIVLDVASKDARSVYDGVLDAEGVLDIPDLDKFTDDHAECSA